MTVVNFPSVYKPALVTSKRIYNGCYPDASVMTTLQEEANRVVAYRVKSWVLATPINAIPVAGGASRVRWNTYIHTSTHCQFAWVRFLTAPNNDTDSAISQVTFTVPGAGAAAATISYEHGSATDSDVPDAIGIGSARPTDSSGLVNLLPDQDYEVRVYDNANARTMAVCIFEYALPHDTDNGYIASGVVAGTPILDTDRQTMVPLLNAAWKVNGKPLFTWSCDTDSDVSESASGDKNVFDVAITTVSTTSPGPIIDTRQQSTVRRASSGVPVLMRAYMKSSIGTATATVKLKDSTGATLATCSTTATTAGWVSSGAFYLPETLAKYDVHVGVTGLGQGSCYAVAIYSYEA